MRNKKSFLKLLILAMVVVVSFAACKKEEAPVTSDEAVTTEPSEAAETVVSEPAVIADAPEGCPKQNTLVVWSQETKSEVPIDADHSWFLEWSPDFATLKFFNYEGFVPKEYGAHSVVGSEVSSAFELTNTNGTELKPGVYTNDKEALDSTTFNKVSNFSIATEESNRGLIAQDVEVEITYKGTDYVCGKMNVDDGYGSFKGEFIAKYYKWGSEK